MRMIPANLLSFRQKSLLPSQWLNCFPRSWVLLPCERGHDTFHHDREMSLCLLLQFGNQNSCRDVSQFCCLQSVPRIFFEDAFVTIWESEETFCDVERMLNCYKCLCARCTLALREPRGKTILRVWSWLRRMQNVWRNPNSQTNACFGETGRE
jgi:hypothetical protein